MLCELLDKVQLVFALVEVSPLVDAKKRDADLHLDTMCFESKSNLAGILADLRGVVAFNLL